MNRRVTGRYERTLVTGEEVARLELAGEMVPSIDWFMYAFAREQIRDPQGLPLSMRLLNETHRRLMRGVRGAGMLPGEVRRSQNWVGGTRPGNAVYVAPPPHMPADMLSGFEQYLHAEDDTPPPLAPSTRSRGPECSSRPRERGATGGIPTRRISSACASAPTWCNVFVVFKRMRNLVMTAKNKTAWTDRRAVNA